MSGFAPLQDTTTGRSSAWRATSSAAHVLVAAGSAAEDTPAGGSPVTVGGVVRTAVAPVTLVAGDAARLTLTSAAALTTAIGAPVASAEVASAARTATGNSGTISVPTGGAISGLIVVSAASGTTPTLDITLEESLDNGTTWQTAWSANRFVAAGNTPIPALLTSGLRRWVWTISGTTPSFTFAINTNQLATPAPIIRSLIDRSITSTTLNSASATLNIDGCITANLLVLSGAGATVAPVYGIRVSEDGTNWADSGLTVSVPASSTITGSITGINAKFAQAYIKTAGTGSTQTYVVMRAIG